MGRWVPLKVARTVERTVSARKANFCQSEGDLELLDLRRGREAGTVVMEAIVRPEIRGRARVNTERVVGIGREWNLVLYVL